jgi:hypothetical protein
MENKLTEFDLNKSNEFIKGWYINKKICQNLIYFFEKNTHLHKNGVTNKGVDTTIKKSTDITIYDNSYSEVNEYLKELDKCIKEYINLYPALNLNVNKWGMIEAINIQKYKPNEGYFKYHCERSAKEDSRLLVFMTYLNDIKDEGETEFLHQKLKIKPEQSLTIIWPSEWTHVHRGIISKTENKYIITGWFSFI